MQFACQHKLSSIIFGVIAAGASLDNESSDDYYTASEDDSDDDVNMFQQRSRHARANNAYIPRDQLDELTAEERDLEEKSILVR